MEKESIRPIYSELKGYLVVAPVEGDVYDEVAVSICNQFNGTIDELNSVTAKDFNKFKVNPRRVDWNRSSRLMIESLDYKNKLSGLINRIQGEFFAEEQVISNQPSTVINASQNQSQSQSQSMAVVLELQEKIISEIPKHKEGSKERTFLEKMKSGLPLVKGVMDILSTALRVGAELGLNASTIHKLLGF